MPRRGRTFWTRLIKQFARSGLTHEAFARQQQVPVGTLRKWLYRLRRETSLAPRFLPVRVVAPLPEALPPAPEAATPSGSLQAQLPDGLRLRFSPGTDSRFVAEVLDRLRRPSC